MSAGQQGLKPVSSVLTGFPVSPVQVNFSKPFGITSGSGQPLDGAAFSPLAQTFQNQAGNALEDGQVDLPNLSTDQQQQLTQLLAKLNEDLLQGDWQSVAADIAAIQQLLGGEAPALPFSGGDGGAPTGQAPVSGIGGGPSGSGGSPGALRGSPSGGGDAGGSLNAPVQDAGGARVDVSGQLEPGGAAGIPAKYKDNPMAQLIWQESKKAGADPYAMLATAIVESGLNPKAVGDNGTSFGLYQYHIGGALGNRSKEWAFNPANIIQDEAKRFAQAGVRNGQGAAAVQRPADQAGYAVKVNNLIAEMKRGA